MKFVIHKDIFQYFPNMQVVVAIAHDINNTSTNPKVTEELKEAWYNAQEASVYGNAQSHPSIKPWREHFKKMGVKASEFPSSIESMLRRALKGGKPFQINPLVDFYNAVSLRHIVPVGGFDLDQIQSKLELRLTKPGDQFTALDAQEPVALPSDEVAYASGSEILTRHFVWRQAKTALITPHTRNVILVCEILGGLEGSLVDQVLSSFKQGLVKHFGVVPETTVLTEQRLSTS
ncbi:B3/B4 domain-containing protein [Melghirimyces algeriensis]|uniref:Phosphoenolpyruvate synthase n=1 Tax=Melghirimyces algeriensis TaxID=910412 RepID=A0A521C143_9BACL|nr:phenylalanine--tRNA ligase beta subunit-related protein [Melghirimyces algeriensis]SMO52521.1 phosphoenolpyruvate synthase [Melghirimyces algeriensis]